MAANALRGEAEITIGETTYKLCFDPNAFIFAEEALGQTTDQIVEEFERTRSRANLRLLRGLFWAGLQREHECHLREAGDLMADAGLSEVKDAITRGMVAAFGVAEKSEGKKPGNPRRKVGAGTG
jgi:hypothetical protein